MFIIQNEIKTIRKNFIQTIHVCCLSIKRKKEKKLHCNLKIYKNYLNTLDLIKNNRHIGRQKRQKNVQVKRFELFENVEWIKESVEVVVAAEEQEQASLAV